MDKNGKVRWGILGTGAIAKTFARNLALSESGQLAAVASRAQQSADAFAGEFKLERRYARYEDLLNDSQIDAIYIALPHTTHALWAIRAAEAGKHLLVEKPMAVNHAQGMAIVEAAMANNVFLMEAFMYRCHPQTAKLIDLIKTGAIGDVRVIEATFSFKAGFNPQSRLFANDLAGGGILDVGCYTVSMARLIAGAALARDFADPIEVTGFAHLGETGVDEWAVASLRFEKDIFAKLSTGTRLNQQNFVRIFGSEGSITLRSPWTADRNAPEKCAIEIDRNGENTLVPIEADRTAFAYEADVAGRAILAGKKQASSPAMSWDDSLANLRTLDRWRSAIGLEYGFEKPAHFAKTRIDGRPFQKSADAKMQYARIEHVEKPISRLVMGCDNQPSFSHVAAMFDDFYSRGGNAYDTAYIYGNGHQEVLLGEWMRLRGVREQTVVIAKGGHTPYCQPQTISVQLIESLARLQTDYADLYVLHRDNPQIPAGEFVDMLNAHVQAGRIRAFGGSNWSIARIVEANEYAKRKGVQGFSLLSNNFSLARMVQPVWRGCISASDAESRAWLKQHNFPVLAWSSQARGFFLPDRAAPDKRDDEELVRCWYSDDNFQRLERTIKLAKDKQVAPINIALAYVLAQPFPTFALIGPRTLAETRTSWPALDVSLSPQEVKWLNLES